MAARRVGGWLMTSEALALAARIVDARAGSHAPTAYDGCPCCGYDGLWGEDRHQAITGVYEMLVAGLMHEP